MAAGGLKSGFVSIVGRPNSGKSTLLNGLVGRKVSIVTHHAQTTRTSVRGIFNDERGQIVFVDTPGIHKPLYRMNERMMRQVADALDHIDIVLLAMDASAGEGAGERFAREMVQKVPSRRFLILNKIDKLRKPALLPLIARHREPGVFDEILPVSALTGDGVPELKAEIFKYLPEGPLYYPEGQISDQPELFLVSEIIREKLILMLREELPHATAIAIEKFEDDANLARIHASILVEKDSQKAIVIGRGGQMLKQVGTAARLELETLLHKRVHLELHVKVRKGWRDNPQALESLGI